MKKPLAFLFGVLASLFFIRAKFPAKQEDPELWKQYIISADSFKTPPGARELKSEGIFPPQNGDDSIRRIGGAKHFAQDPRGRIFIPDWRNDEVLVFDDQGKFQFAFGQTGQGPGDFINPSNLYISDTSVLVRDISTMRFQFFDLNGKFKRGFNAFKGYNSFFLKGENIYAAPVLSRPPENGIGLIEELDLEGRVQLSFGAPLVVPKYDFDMLNSTRIAPFEDGRGLYVAFQFFPIIRAYTLDGKLMNEIRLKSGISDKIAPLNAKMIERRYKGEVVPYGFVINAINPEREGIYIASAAQRRLEIILLSQKGEIIEYFYRNLETPIGCNGLLIRRIRGRREFVILRMDPESCVEVLSPK